MRAMILIQACLLALLFGCASSQPTVFDAPLAPEIQTHNIGAGSLYRQGVGGVYGDRRARNIGDIVTVNVIEQASASKQESTQTDRTSDMDASMTDTFGLPTNYGMADFLKSGNPFTPSLKGNYKRAFKGSGAITASEKLVATVAAKVVEVMPGGNLRIYGTREVKVNRERQTIVLQGIVRTEDIAPTNTIASTQMADAQITYMGRGVIGDTQGPGWLSRAMDWIWPL